MVVAITSRNGPWTSLPPKLSCQFEQTLEKENLTMERER